MIDEERKRVLFVSGTENRILAITDAPKEEIEKWCYMYNAILDNKLKLELMRDICYPFYVKVILDSELGDDDENFSVIGCDETYNWKNYQSDDNDADEEYAVIEQVMREAGVEDSKIYLGIAEIKMLRKKISGHSFP